MLWLQPVSPEETALLERTLCASTTKTSNECLCYVFLISEFPEHRDNTYPGDAKTFKVVVSAHKTNATENVKIPHSLSRNS